MWHTAAAVLELYKPLYPRVIGDRVLVRPCVTEAHDAAQGAILRAEEELLEALMVVEVVLVVTELTVH